MIMEQKIHPPTILAGMHRSGTSLIAGFLHQCGIQMGDAFVAADDANPRGYSEDEAFVRFHTQVIQRVANSSWFAPEPIVPNEEEKEAGRELLRARGKAVPWGWKDPRSCLFLEFWRELCPEAKFLFVFRSPFAVVDSLHRRENEASLHWRARGQWLRGWRVYTEACERFARRYPEQSFFFALEDLTRAPERMSSALSKFTGHPIDAEVLKKNFHPSELRPGPGTFRELFKLPQHDAWLAWSTYRRLQRRYANEEC